MKRLVYCVIIAMSISLVFPIGKSCCKKKAGKNPVSCKFNQANIAGDKDATGKLTEKVVIDSDQKLSQCCNATVNQCANATNKPWWKFWAKKSNCPCRQADTTETSTTG